MNDPAAAAGTAPPAARYVGQSVARLEDPRLLTGRGRYVANLAPVGTGHVAFARSTRARARITRLDVKAAAALDGVWAVWTADGLNGDMGSMRGSLVLPGGGGPPDHLLADGDVRFVGDPVAVNVYAGTGSHGQSLETTMAQIVADALGVHPGDVRFHQGHGTPYGFGTGGSRSAVIAGGAARAASAGVRAKLLRVAAELMEASVDDLDLGGGAVSVRGTPARRTTVAEVARAAYMRPDTLPADISGGLEHTARFKAPPVTYSNAAHACTCEVDVATGAVRLLRYAVSEDCGVMINPMVVKGQIAGGAAQGIGGALLEEVAYDADGNPLATTFADYLVPSAAEIPSFEFGHIVTPSDSPGGHKGTGEGGAIGSVPCVFNAVADALAPLGVRLTDGPLSPQRIRAAIVEACA